MELDFGGIGKEYAADRAAAILREHGIVHALVNLACDVVVIGTRPDGTPWRVGIQHPREPASVVADLATLAGSYATLAMLFAADAPAFLAGQGAHYLAIAADGTMAGNMPFSRGTS